jgi:hypothetical protein
MNYFAHIEPSPPFGDDSGLRNRPSVPNSKEGLFRGRFAGTIHWAVVPKTIDERRASILSKAPANDSRGVALTVSLPRCVTRSGR